MSISHMNNCYWRRRKNYILLVADELLYQVKLLDIVIVQPAVFLVTKQFRQRVCDREDKRGSLAN